MLYYSGAGPLLGSRSLFPWLLHFPGGRRVVANMQVSFYPPLDVPVPRGAEAVPRRAASVEMEGATAVLATAALLLLLAAAPLASCK